MPISPATGHCYKIRLGVGAGDGNFAGPYYRKHHVPRLTPSPMFGAGRPDTEDRSDWVGGRAPIFGQLDTYISAGWGHVPRALIERARSENGGVLPAPEQAPWYCRAFFAGNQTVPATPEQRALIFRARSLYLSTREH